MNKEKDITEQQFCEVFTAVTGEPTDNIKQLTFKAFHSGEELLEFINDFNRVYRKFYPSPIAPSKEETREGIPEVIEALNHALEIISKKSPTVAGLGGIRAYIKMAANILNTVDEEAITETIAYQIALEAWNSKHGFFSFDDYWNVHGKSHFETQNKQ